MRQTNRPGSRGVPLLLLGCFFASGLTGLMHEVLWTRMVVQVIGAAPFAVALVLGVFMGGLGIGSWLASLLLHRGHGTAELLRVYGVLELIVAGYSLLVPTLLSAFRPLSSLLYERLQHDPVLFAALACTGCALLLLLPVVCMGATLPVLSKAYVTSLSRLGERVGRLYAINTLGAALGALVCGFWLVEALGVIGTLLVAAATNALIGAVAVMVAPRMVSSPTRPAEAPARGDHREEIGESRSAGSRAEPIAALLVFAVSGFCAMSYEVVWTRLLGLVIGPTTYSFTIILVTFITGLALGNGAFGWLADRTRDLTRLLVITQLAAAGSALISSQLLGTSQVFFARLILRHEGSFASLNVWKAVFVFAIILAPTFCLGATFPIVTKLYTASLGAVGRSVGIAYAVNTAGCVLGSLCAGFVLVPLVGKERGLALTAAVQTSVALALVLVMVRGLRSRVLASISALAVLALSFTWPSWNRQSLSFGKYQRLADQSLRSDVEKMSGWQALVHGVDLLARKDPSRLVYYGDGIGGFVTVLAHQTSLGETVYSMANSGKADASSKWDMSTQTLLAHFPMLFHRDPRRVMVLGLASGVTAGEVLHYPVDELDVVDINPQVVAASRWFRPWNNGVLSDPRTTLFLQDGRAHLALSRRTYDVIISEPSNPWMAGMAALFTREFFAHARDRLADDGILVQWLHAYQMDWPTVSLVGRTFATVFPRSFLVSTDPSGQGRDYLLVGFKGRALPVLEAVRARADYARKSSNVVIPDPAILYRLVVSEDVARLCGLGEVDTDGRPVLEFTAPRLMHQTDAAMGHVWGAIAGSRSITQGTLSLQQRLSSDLDAQIDFAAFALSVYSPFVGMVDLTRASPSQRARWSDIVAARCAEDDLTPLVGEDRPLATRCRLAQIGSLTRRLGSLWDPAAGDAQLGRLYYEVGRKDEAAAAFERALRTGPDDPGVRNNLGFVLTEIGQHARALGHYERALRLRPESPAFLGNYADALAHLGRDGEAFSAYARLAGLVPDQPEPHRMAGLTALRLGDRRRALPYLRQALRLDPASLTAVRGLAWALATASEPDVFDPRGAVEWAERARTLAGGDDPGVLYTLALAHAADGQYPKAIQEALRAQSLVGVSAHAHASLSRTLGELMTRLRSGTSIRDLPLE